MATTERPDREPPGGWLKEPTKDCQPGGVHFTCKTKAFPDYPQCPCSCHRTVGGLSHD